KRSRFFEGGQGVFLSKQGLENLTQLPPSRSGTRNRLDCIAERLVGPISLAGFDKNLSQRQSRAFVGRPQADGRLELFDAGPVLVVQPIGRPQTSVDFRRVAVCLDRGFELTNGGVYLAFSERGNATLNGLGFRRSISTEGVGRYGLTKPNDCILVF